MCKARFDSVVHDVDNVRVQGIGCLLSLVWLVGGGYGLLLLSGHTQDRLWGLPSGKIVFVLAAFAWLLVGAVTRWMMEAQKKKRTPIGEYDDHSRL